MKKLGDTFSISIPPVHAEMTTVHALYFETVLLSLISDTELSTQEKKKKLEGAFKKLESLEKACGGPSSIRAFMHHLILKSSTDIVLGQF